MSLVLDFNDLTPIEIKVPIAGKEYFLREASGDASCQFKNRAAASVTMVDGKVTSVRNAADLEPFLVSLCLFDTEGKAVSEKTIRGWPNRVQKALFNKAKEISELDEPPRQKEDLKAALQREGAPVSWDDFVEWLLELPDDQYRELKIWLVGEELAKNERATTQTGST